MLSIVVDLNYVASMKIGRKAWAEVTRKDDEKDRKRFNGEEDSRLKKLDVLRERQSRGRSSTATC